MAAIAVDLFYSNLWRTRNANYGSVAKDGQNVQIITGSEDSQNDIIINQLGRQFGMGVVINKSISQYAIKNWFYSTNAPLLG
jgi:hypothetical protein